MGLLMEIARIVLPVIVAAIIGLFIVMRMKHKSNQGNLGKKETKSAQDLLDSLIPIGMVFGCVIGIICSMFFGVSLLVSLSLGAAIGLLFGYIAYEIYSRRTSKPF